MDTNKMREQFEAKYPIPAGVAWKEAIGMYEVVDIWKLDQAITIGKYNWLWEGWQASREAVVVHLPQPFVGDDFTMYDGKEICAAIEAQGLKVAP